METYDKYIVAFSGGKDSTACLLYLLDQGVPKEKIELWHHDIDGHGATFMDWECTPAYCIAFAEAFDIPIYFSWKQGGFKMEMLRDNDPTAETWFEVPKSEWEKAENRAVKSNASKYPGYYMIAGGTGPKGTRMKFPQVSPDLSVRWCSAYLKIDVCATAIRNQERFKGIKTLVISGERGEESAARGKYAIFEPDRADLRNGKKFSRWVDRWRPIRDWSESDVWNIIEKYKVRVHPAYYLGWGRVSCKFCIFGNANQFASAFVVSPEIGNNLADYEKYFGITIKRKESLLEFIAKGKPYEAMSKELILIATANYYDLNIFMNKWILPAGAYGDGCGPT